MKLYFSILIFIFCFHSYAFTNGQDWYVQKFMENTYFTNYQVVGNILTIDRTVITEDEDFDEVGASRIIIRYILNKEYEKISYSENHVDLVNFAEKSKFIVNEKRLQFYLSRSNTRVPFKKLVFKSAQMIFSLGYEGEKLFRYGPGDERRELRKIPADQFDTFLSAADMIFNHCPRTCWISKFSRRTRTTDEEDVLSAVEKLKSIQITLSDK